MFIEHLNQDPTIETVVVVGAADGKFVLPLLRAGYSVTAIEVNNSAVHGYGDTRKGKAAERYSGGGLTAAAREVGLQDKLTIVNADVRTADIFPRDALWTSCSWHYSLNHDQPLSRFFDAMKRCVRPGGILGAEYFMPVAPKHVETEHYLEQGEVWRYLQGWRRNWEAYTPVFVEAPHLGQPDVHVHRMGFFIATSSG
ncbi:class I SAM-dependent methyltransferase [Gandjariella thermophila]|uniref:class I SAM-dependent methyltransferase n=1 Tax=Gandjariella thermophila TaxID=1931992 RepID=UPI00186515C8|nr:methyltransferase domain-containing protein [Gandjariella thermophila]